MKGAISSSVAPLPRIAPARVVMARQFDSRRATTGIVMPAVEWILSGITVFLPGNT